MKNHAEFEDLCAAAALGALDGRDRDRLREHLPGCAACRQRVAEFAESSTWVALGLAPIEPSAAVKSAVMARISGQQPAARKGEPSAAGAEGGAGAGPPLLVWIALGVAGLTLAGALAVGYLYSSALGRLDRLRSEGEVRQAEREVLAARVEQLEAAARARTEELANVRAALEEEAAALAAAETSTEDLRAELAGAERELERLRRIERLLQDVDTQIVGLSATPAAPADARGRVLWNDREVVLVAEGLPPLNGKTYELWAITPGRDPQKAGLFPRVDAGGATLGLHALSVHPGAVDKFAISLEPPGGSPDPNGPSGDVILITP